MSVVSRLAAAVVIVTVSSAASCRKSFFAHQAFTPVPDWSCIASAVQESDDLIQVRILHRPGYQWLVAKWADTTKRNQGQEIGIVRRVQNQRTSDTVTVIVSSRPGEVAANDVGVGGPFALKLFHAIAARCETQPTSEVTCELGGDAVRCV